MNALEDSFLEVAHGSPSRVLYGTTVGWVQRNSDGTFTSHTADGAQVATSRTVVLATGAREGNALPEQAGGRVLASADVLAGTLDEIEEAVVSGGGVTIVGGSHSGFAVASLVLSHCADHLREGQLSLVHRGVELIFDDYASAQEWYDRSRLGSPTPPVCPETGMVNRFKGLRGPPRRLCQDVVEGAEPRLRLCHVDEPDAPRLLSDAAVVVNAAGYRTVAVELRDEHGRTIEVGERAGNVAVDDQCRVLDGSGSVIDGVYGIGLGYARLDPNGDGRVGVNIFHGGDAEQIVNGLLARVPAAPV